MAMRPDIFHFFLLVLAVSEDLLYVFHVFLFCNSGIIIFFFHFPSFLSFALHPAPVAELSHISL